MACYLFIKNITDTLFLPKPVYAGQRRQLLDSFAHFLGICEFLMD